MTNIHTSVLQILRTVFIQTTVRTVFYQAHIKYNTLAQRPGKNDLYVCMHTNNHDAYQRDFTCVQRLVSLAIKVLVHTAYTLFTHCLLEVFEIFRIKLQQN